MKVTVVDYGMGNLGSIANMLRVLGCTALVASDAKEILAAEKLILPGVGSFDAGMKRLREHGLVEALNESVLHRKTHVLGICLGMQLMSRCSEEGNLEGLGWINAVTERFRNNEMPLRIPHMGWNTVRTIKQYGLTNDLESNARFYFVHGYHLAEVPLENVVLTTHYGYEFVSAIASDNIHGVQFHPEKSHRFGLRLLKNFVELV